MAQKGSRDRRPPVEIGGLRPELPRTVIQDLEAIIPKQISQLAPLLDRFAQMSADLEPVQTSYFVLNVDPPPLKWDQKPAALKDEEFELASCLWDLHSACCGHYLHVWWRVDQLVRGACQALTAWELIAGASLVRSLFETAVAFHVEHQSLLAMWERFKADSFPKWPDIARFHTQAGKQLSQMIMGTREERILEIGRLREVLSRKSVLTLLSKVEREQPDSDLRVVYEALCDAVHPSHGSNSVFWTKLDVAEIPTPQFQIELARRAAGWSVVPAAVVDGLIWSLGQLLDDLQRFWTFTVDMCLTARVGALQDLQYWGHVESADPYVACPCGSGAKIKFCRHDFGKVTGSS